MAKVEDADGKKIEVNVFFEKKPTGKRGSRKKVLTPEAVSLIENLARIMCTDEEIADILGCSRDLFYTEDNAENFRQAIKKGQSQGRQSLRREQWKVAQKGNVTMLIWLGRQWLGQKDFVVEDKDGDEFAAKMAQAFRERKRG